jgi:hypothetical protein
MACSGISNVCSSQHAVPDALSMLVAHWRKTLLLRRPDPRTANRRTMCGWFRRHLDLLASNYAFGNLGFLAAPIYDFHYAVMSLPSDFIIFSG